MLALLNLILFQRNGESDSASNRESPQYKARLEHTISSNVEKAFVELEIEFRKSRLFESLDLPASKFWEIFNNYRENIEYAIRERFHGGHTAQSTPFAEQTIAKILQKGGNPDNLQSTLKIGLYNRIMNRLFTQKQLERQSSITDCRYPMEWFPKARQLQRTLHLHVGPTNSGKTYNALKKLEEAKTGCYAGPLRLLAQEIYARMNARGKPTYLITGDDQQMPTIPVDEGPEGNSKGVCTSCTVEMINYNTVYDVAVIDEVQMAADSSRGHSWTSAIVGVPAKQVHLCGEERTVPFVQELARSLGEELVIHRYKRLSPLAVMKSPIQGIQQLEKGDCIVCFSVKRIHAMKQYVEKATGKRCAIIYGSLPPEVRAQQARLFNEPDNEYEYLVASDAVGMGLNL